VFERPFCSEPGRSQGEDPVFGGRNITASDPTAVDEKIEAGQYGNNECKDQGIKETFLLPDPTLSSLFYCDVDGLQASFRCSPS